MGIPTPTRYSLTARSTRTFVGRESSGKNSSALTARLTAHLPGNHWNAKQASQPVQKHADPNTRSQMRGFIARARNGA